MNVPNSFTARSKHLKTEENCHADNFRKSQSRCLSCTSDTQGSAWLGWGWKDTHRRPGPCPEDLWVHCACAGWKLSLEMADWAQKGVARAGSGWEGKGFTEEVRCGVIPPQGTKEVQEEQVRWSLI